MLREATWHFLIHKQCFSNNSEMTFYFQSLLHLTCFYHYKNSLCFLRWRFLKLISLCVTSWCVSCKILKFVLLLWHTTSIKRMSIYFEYHARKFLTVHSLLSSIWWSGVSSPFSPPFPFRPHVTKITFDVLEDVAKDQGTTLSHVSSLNIRVEVSR